MSSVISTQDFLDAVLPEGNHYIGYTDGTLNRGGRPVIKCSAFNEGLQGVTIAQSRAARHEGADIYFALAAFKEAKVYDAERGFMKSHRVQENVESLKAIWLDVDFKMYESPKACGDDIARFLQDFPKPTFLVNSGGGLHLYWVFEKPLTPIQWTPLAQGLAAIAKAKKLRADYGVTIDSARVLRLPGSTNHKYSNKPTCEVLSMGSYASLDRMDELLRPHAAAMSTSGITVDANVVAMFDPVTQNNDLSEGFVSGKRSFFAAISQECGVVKDSLDRRGNGDGYPLWKDLLHLLAFTEDGADYIAALSDGDARYDPDNAEDFYQQSVKIKLDGTRGPTTCARFSTHSDKCAVCPHAGKIKTPWMLGVPIEEKFARVPSFVRNGKTYITEMVEEDGEQTLQEVPILNFEMDNWHLVPDVDGGLILHVDVINGKSKKTVALDARDKADVKQLKIAMDRGAVGLTDGQAGKVKRIVMEWTTHLSAIREGTTYTRSGWNDAEDAFVMGDRAILADRVEPVLNATLAEAQTVGVKGKPEPWLKLAQKLLDDEDPAFTYLLCAGMAAPLMGVLSHRTSLAISAFSTNSGAGKTTALRCVRAAFGKPKGGFSLNDTATSIVIKLGAEQGIPAIYDEIRGTEVGESIVNVLFQMTEGKTKMRANQSAQIRKQETINTVMLCGSNIPISDYVNQRVKNSNAGFARFIEIELEPKKLADPELDAMVSELETNYGHFGPALIAKIVEDMDKLKAAEKVVGELLQKKRQWTPEERFWLQGTTKILLVGSLINKMGDLKVDTDKLLDFSLKAVEGQKAEMRDRVVQEDTLLASLMDFLSDHTLVTEEFKRTTGRGSVRVLREPVRSRVDAQIAVKNATVRITMDALGRFCEEFSHSTKRTKRQLEHRFAAKSYRKAIGAGTQYNASARNVIDLDLKNGDVDEQELISSWLPADHSS